MTPRRTTSGRAGAVVAPVLALTIVVTLGAATDPAAAAVLHVPRHATITIDGHGYGHGHGMSQYGAEGAARKGLSANQIVRFYYPHTRAGTFKGKVRVLISADTDQNTTVVNQPGLKVHDLGNGSTVALPRTGKAGQATRWRFSSKSGKPAQVSYRTDSWHLWRTLAGDGEFRATRPIRLVLPGGTMAYRGTLQSRTSTRGGSKAHRITVNRVSMEDYVRAVVPREAFPSWHQAALRAQAIAARSYAAFEVGQPLSPLYQLCDTTDCQVYGGVSAETATTDQATTKTAGQIRTYRGKPAFTQFSSSNGGWLAKGTQPYLVAKKDPYDRWSGNPNHTWRTTVSDAQIEKAWPSLGNLTGISVDRRDGHGQWNGRILRMTLIGSRGSVRFGYADTDSPPVDDFRFLLGLRSTWINLSIAG
jgi:stage II sporulation protein D